MIYWVVDNKLSLLVFLGVNALVLGVLRFKTRDGRYTAGLILVGILAIVVSALGFFVQTNQKRIVHAINEMAAGVKAKDSKRIFDHISDEFRLGGLDKSSFRGFVDRVLASGRVSEIDTWDFEPVQLEPLDATAKREATISFKVKPKGELTGDERFYLCKARFVEADGQWRLKGFQIFNPLVDSNVPISIPDLPP